MFDHFKPIDQKLERRKRYAISMLAFVILMGSFGYWRFRNFAEERQALHFFEALHSRNFQQAYQIWQPNSTYKFQDFMDDWGEQGLQGPVEDFRLVRSRRRGTGVIVEVRVNNAENVRIWVERGNKSLTFPPY